MYKTKNIINTRINDWKVYELHLSLEQFGGESDQLNIYGDKLESCSEEPMTGWYRNSYCETDSIDSGKHTVCAKVTDEFLRHNLINNNNDLISSRGKSFPGLKDGDKWCICHNIYKDAKNNNIELEVYPRSTNISSKNLFDKTSTK